MKPTPDFKAIAHDLLKRIGPATSRELAVAAVEVALREMFAAGQGIPPVRKAPVATAPSVTARRTPTQADELNQTEDEIDDCAHVWEEAFLDGRGVGMRCSRCEVLQSKVQNRCEHYFVRTGPNETCVACRKTRAVGAR